ncbi:unnamed protein product [Sphagnum balticum]
MVPEGGQIVQPAHTTAQPGNLGLWRRVNNLQPPGPSKGKPEGTMAQVMEQPAQEAHKFEVEQVTVAHPHKHWSIMPRNGQSRKVTWELAPATTTLPCPPPKLKLQGSCDGSAINMAT